MLADAPHGGHGDSASRWLSGPREIAHFSHDPRQQVDLYAVDSLVFSNGRTRLSYGTERPSRKIDLSVVLRRVRDNQRSYGFSPPTMARHARFAVSTQEGVGCLIASSSSLSPFYP